VFFEPNHELVNWNSVKSNKRFLAHLIAGVLGVSLLLVAHAKDDGTDPSSTVEKEIQKFVINADATYVLTVDRVVLINEERAIKSGQSRWHSKISQIFSPPPRPLLK
jgi:hypothetical protein